MADLVLRQAETIPPATQSRWRDFGDGTHGQVVGIGPGAAAIGNVGILDGADITQGALADAAITSNAAGSISGKLRGLVAILADVWNNGLNLLNVDLTQIQKDDTDKLAVSVYGTDAAAGDKELNASAAGNLETDIHVAGVPPQLDDTDKLAVSLYAKGSAAGDSELLVESAPQHNLRVALFGAGSQAGVANYDGSDNQSFTNELAVMSLGTLYNGSLFDRQRNNVEATLLASAARTATTNVADQTNYNGKRLLLVVDVTSITDTPSVTPSLQIKDSISGDYITVWTAAAALTATGEVTYYFADGASGGSFTEIEPFGLPSRTWRVVMTHADADSITYSVSAVVMP